MLRFRLSAASRTFSRAAQRPLAPHRLLPVQLQTRLSSSHAEETYDEFTTRYVNFFSGVQDIFELQRGLNNAFAYDLVPSPKVIEAALRAARRVNDFSTCVRIFEGIEEKVENSNQYAQYLEELKGIREELGRFFQRKMVKFTLISRQVSQQERSYGPNRPDALVRWFHFDHTGGIVAHRSYRLCKSNLHFKILFILPSLWSIFC